MMHVQYFSIARTASWLLLAIFVAFTASQEAQHVREYFFVGGQYVSTSSGTVFQDQMYVEKLSPPLVSQPYPIVFMHGNGQDGTNFLNKPDGGRGWASWFLETGYEIYIVDETARGRSAYNPESGLALSSFSAEYVSSRFTAVRSSNLWPQAKLHTQWPGSGMMGDPIFDAHYQSLVPGLVNDTEHERTMKDAGIALLNKTGPAILVTHSKGGLYGWSIADARPDDIKALIQLEPKGPPFVEAVFSTEFSKPWGLTTIPLGFEPTPTNMSAPLATQVVEATAPDLTSCVIQAEPARRLPNLARVPILVETGEASYHAVYDYCTVLFLRQAGVEAQHLELSKPGIHGNGHMQFLEKNSDVIAAELHKWIADTLKA